MNSHDKAQEPSREQLILEAATREFSLKGFDGARTTEIARQAGVTHAMLHYYFRTKEQLFEQIMMKVFEQLLELMLSTLKQPGKSLRERIAAGVVAHFDFVRCHRELPLFVINAINREPERLGELREKLSAYFLAHLMPMQAEIDAAVERGEMNRVSIISLMVTMVSLNIGPFVARPMIESLLPIGDFEAMLDSRREENVNIMLKICFD